ncbi:MAG TPA: DUF1801 domain-containing protein [Steroidobacteraceae bacterium]|nr:DUF1801 domain-containing protein [Steroidobacteraceae bacterium]
MTDPIASYGRKFPGESAAICRLLRSEIRAAMPKATAKLWHAMPVWFIGKNPVVGYKVTAKHVNLLFWNGQSLHEPGLKAAGKFKAAQTQFSEVDGVDTKRLRRWLKQARTDVWDYAGLRGRRAGAA